MKRDKNIDYLRTFAMMLVIIIHVLYFGEFFDNEYVNIIKSFFLFEMPLFFFITGASNELSKSKNYFEFVCKRFKRILIPYWIFAFVFSILSIIKFSVESKISLIKGICIFLSWILPLDMQKTSISYITNTIWFIPVYLSIILIVPLLKKIKKSSKKFEFIFVLLIIFFITALFKMGWIQNFTFYTFWTYIGLFYYDIKDLLKQKKLNIYLIISIILGFITMILLFFNGQSLDMQINKFPPNIMFFVFSIITMSLIILSIKYLSKFMGFLNSIGIFNKVFKSFSTHGITLFLYQGIAFNISNRLTNIIIPYESFISPFLKFIVCLIIIIPVCFLITSFIGRFETISYNKNNK